MPIERTIMPRHRLPQLVLLALLLSASLAAATPPRIASTAPEHQPATVDLEPLWTRGGEDDEEVLFGVIFQVQTDEDDRIYLLDAQLSHVEVFDRAGEHVGRGVDVARAVGVHAR